MTWQHVLIKHFGVYATFLQRECSVIYNGNTFFIRKRSNPNRFKIVLKNPNNPEKYINDNISLSELISTIKNYNESTPYYDEASGYVHTIPINITIGAEQYDGIARDIQVERLMPQSYEETLNSIRENHNLAIADSSESFRMPVYGHYHLETDQQLSRRITYEQSLDNSEIPLIDEIPSQLRQQFIDAYAPTQGGYYSAIFDPEESEVRAQGQLTTCNCDDCLAEREET